jgi:hypothetical protein
MLGISSVLEGLSRRTQFCGVSWVSYDRNLVAMRRPPFLLVVQLQLQSRYFVHASQRADPETQPAVSCHGRRHVSELARKSHSFVLRTNRLHFA